MTHTTPGPGYFYPDRLNRGPLWYGALGLLG
jgi:hypothetical protein